MPHLSRPCHALACRDRFSDGRDRHRSGSVIQRTVDACDVSLLLVWTHLSRLGFDPGQGGRQAARQIHMDFIRTTWRVRAQFADPAGRLLSSRTRDSLGSRL